MSGKNSVAGVASLSPLNLSSIVRRSKRVATFTVNYFGIQFYNDILRFTDLLYQVIGHSLQERLYLWDYNRRPAAQEGKLLLL